MKWKACLVYACLLLGAILIACGVDAPNLPRGARRALDDYLSADYSIMSAQQALHAAGGDEAWCVAVDTELKHIIEVLCVGDGPFDPEECGSLEWPIDVIIVVKRGDEWQADPWYDYVSYSGYNYAKIVEQLPVVLMWLECDSLMPESEPAPQ